ncbi:MAG: RHS repeat-associated core domain-containing protein [Bacteroidaceae bacterium]|nr:RHS repeat-associated core domain-containing protein [Bacteroidaceae bacterium]
MITLTRLDASGSNLVQSVQYYDGLGRESVLAQGGVNTSGKYVYTMTEYDLLGREAKTWLPAVGTTSPNIITANTISTNSQNTYEGDAYAFSEITYDALGRPIFVSTPGEAWHQAGKGVTTEYKTNAANSVKRYAVASAPSFIVQDGYYPQGSLTCVRTIDEDTLTKEVYKDLLGNIILERRCSGGSNSDNDTYYVYDHGLLSVVVPPLYQTTQEASLLYVYTYDNLGRCVSKTLPGCEPVSYWYDSGSRVSFIQDARMSDLGKYRFFLYDGLGRMVVQGLCTNGSIGDARLANVTFDHTVQGLCGTGYVLQSGYSLSNPEIEIVNYYDGYDCLQTTAISPYVNQYNLQTTPAACATTLLTAQIVAATNGERLFRVMYYDEKGQLTEQRSSHLNGMRVQDTNSYTFTGKPLNTLTGMLRSGYLSRYFNTAYSYDSHSDLMASKTISGMYIPSIPMSYTYDNLGRLSAESDGLKVNTTYTYDLHGWQKSRLSQTDQGNLLFSQDLYYADGHGTKRYNGNISSMRYNSSSSQYGYSGYRYEYDRLGRLLTSKYCIGENVSLYNYMHSESAEYDANSNITHFTRNGPTVTGYGDFDDIYFTYSGNQLRSTYDVGGSQQAAGVFEYRKAALLYQEHYYDGCGAMTADMNKGICHIDYDLNGKPTRIQFTNGNVTEYINSADGIKLRTIHRTAVSGLTIPLHQTHTLTPAETMNVDSTTYSCDVEIDQSRNTKWYFGEGYIHQTPSSTITTYYTIKDYLGNIRKVMKSDGTIVQAQNYYAFGGILNETNNYTDIQTHKYNGKEYDPMHGLNEYDYGARHYDPAIGKFTTMDPLCEKYYHISPYAYCLGNPVVFFDPNGEEPTPAEAALMAMHVTGRWANWILSGGWKPAATNFGIELPQAEGLKSRIYERELEDHSKEYAYVTAGTDFFSYDDWKNNFLQLSGESTQYRESVGVAKKLADLIDKKYLTFVGSSLGGGLASANAEATGYKAITFNAAGLSNATKRNLELNIPAEIDAYIVRGEILDNSQRVLGLKAEGTIKYLPAMNCPLPPKFKHLKSIMSHDINLISANLLIKEYIDKFIDLFK